MHEMQAVIDAIAPLDEVAQAQALARQETLTKPAGSLGRLEEIAVRLAGITGQVRPTVARKAVVVLASDHGVAVEGVSAYPAEVTPQMVQNFLRGGAAINALARQVGARVVIVDVGVAATIDHPGLIKRKVAPGTANMAEGPAMTREQAVSAAQVGMAVLDELVAQGLDLVATGEMGIGNTTAASALTAALTGRSAQEVTGYGTGISATQHQHKVQVIERALVHNAPDPADPLDVLAKIGGLEIAGLVGLILAAAAQRVPVVIDGFITGAAALVAVRLCPQVRDYLFAGHVSVEQGHRIILETLELRPLLDLGLRLGEGTGAVLAMSLIEAATRAHAEMATFAEAAVSQREDIGPDTPGDQRATFAS